VHQLAFTVPSIYLEYLLAKLSKRNDIVEFMGSDGYGICPTLLFTCIIVLLPEDMSAASNY